jgi:hypothetical protein
MGRLAAAFRIFYRTLFDAATAEQVRVLLTGAPPTPTPTPIAPARPVEPPAPKQNPAVTLLATLQRESRLVDFLREDLAPYTDEQIGASVREVHRDAAKVLERVFGLTPVLADAEGGDVEVPIGFDAGRVRLTGKIAGSPPFRGALRHHGWQASRCELPTYTGSADAAQTIAPAEVEVG